MKRKPIYLSVTTKMLFLTFMLFISQYLKSENNIFSSRQQDVLLKNSTCYEYFSSHMKESFFGIEVEFINPILPELVICGDAGRASIEIVKLANGRVINNTQLSILLDEGLKYGGNFQAIGCSGVNSNVTYRNDLSNERTIVFDFPSMDFAGCKNILFSFDVKADCDVIDIVKANPGVVFNWEYTLRFNGGMDVYSESTIPQLAKPNLTISNPTITPLGGNLTSRKFTICQTGVNSYIKDTIQINDFGASTMRIRGVKINGGVENSNYVKGNLGNQSIVIPRSEFSNALLANGTTGNRNDLLDGPEGGNSSSLAECIEIEEIIEIVSCTDLSSTINAYWGCNQQLCEPSESIFTNLSLSSSQGPKLEISENYEAPTCLGTNTTIQVKIKNTGTSAASNSLIDFYLYAGSVEQIGTCNGGNLSPNSFRISRNSGAFTQITPHYFNSINCGSYFGCFTSNITSHVQLLFPSIAVGEEITIEYEKSICCPKDPGNYYSFGDGVKGKYYDFCNNENELKPVSVSDAVYVSNTLILDETKPNIKENDTFTMKLVYHLFRFSNVNDNSEIELVLDIPQGITWSGNNNDLMWTNPYGEMWDPISINYNPIQNKIVARYNIKAGQLAGIGLFKSEIFIKKLVLGSCAILPNEVQIKSQFNYISDPLNCSCAVPIGADTLRISPKCIPSNSNCLGLLTLGSDMKRISYGLKDINGDQLPDGSQIANPSVDPINTYRAMSGDLLSATHIAVVKDATNDLWDFGYLESSFEIAPETEVRSAIVQIYDKSANRAFSCNPLVSRKNANTFKFEFGRTALLGNSCTDLGSFEGFRNGDSIKLEIIYEIAKNRPAVIVENVVQNSFYISKTSNPTNPNLNDCQQYINRFNYYGYGSFGQISGAIFNGCEDKFIQFSYSYINHPYDASAGRDVFPFEYRPQNLMNLVSVNLPLGYNFLRSEIDLIVGRGKERNVQLSSPINPINTSSRNLEFNVGQLFKSQNASGIWDTPDDAYNLSIKIYLAPDCNATTEKVSFSYTAIHQGQLSSLPSNGGNTDSSDDLSKSTESNTEVLFFTPPQISLQSTKQTNNGASPTLTWPLKINNVASETEAKNVWIAFRNNSGRINVNNLRVGGTIISPSAGNIYQLGDLRPGGSEFDLLLSANYSLNCNLDSIVAEVGWNCIGYPSSTTSNTCPIESYPLYVKPFNTSLSASSIFPIESRPITVKDLCEDIEFVIQVDNEGQVDASNLLFSVFLPAGFELIPGSTYIQYPITTSVPPAPNVSLSNWKRISDARNIGADPLGQKHEWNITSAWRAATGTNGLGGVGGEVPYQLKNADSSRYYIRFLAQTKCGFVDGTRIPYRTSAQSPCQIGTSQKEESITGYTAPIHIIDPNTLYSGRLAIGASSSTLNACSDFNEVELILYNFGPGSTRLTDTIKLTLPNGYSYIPLTTRNIRNFGGAEPTLISSSSGETKVAWAIGTITVPGDSIKFKFSIDVDPSITTCNSIRNFMNMVITTRDLACADDGSICRTQLTLAEANHPTVYTKASYQITRQNTTCPDITGRTYTTLSLGILDADLSSSQNIRVRIFEDLNRNGLLDSADSLAAPIATHIVSGPLSRGNLNLDFNYITNRDRLRNALVFVDGSCSCFPLISRLYPPICTACVPIGDYVWHDANRNGLQDIDEVGLNGITVQLYEQNGVLFSTKVTSTNPQTGKDGYFKFCTCEGTYYLKVQGPSNYTRTITGLGSNPTTDSDISTINGENTTPIFIAREGDMLCDFDAGFYRTSALGNILWNDVNGDGIYQIMEPGIQGINVHLINVINQTIQTSQTNEDGSFTFDEVPAGNYYVKVDMPLQYSFTSTKKASLQEMANDVDGSMGYGTTSIFKLTQTSLVENISIGVVKLVLASNDFNLNATDYNNSAVLQWDVKNSKQIQKFIIERINSDGSVNILSEIQMTNKTKKSYFYIDASIEEAKKYYYRIKQIFEDQTSENSNVAMLEIGKLNVLKVYPNLITSDEIQIQINSATDEMGTLAILSIDGKEIRRELAKVKISKGLQKSAIQLHHLAAGKYILALKCDSGKVYYENIVKQ